MGNCFDVQPPGCEEGIIISTQPVEKHEQYRPYNAAPVEMDFRPGQSLLPRGPMAVLHMVLAKGLKGSFVITCCNHQTPAILIFWMFDSGFDSLAYQHQTPIHGLPFRTDWDFCYRELHVGD